VPLGQSEHDAEPDRGWAEPSVQLPQLVDPSDGWAVPALQALQLDRPTEGW
jgi:hypothetical protein